MRTYEALYIVRPELDDENIQTIVGEVETIVKDNGGSIVRSEIWGKRRLAYEVKKCNEGCYILLRFTSEPDSITRLEAHFRLAESVVRSLIVHFDDQMLRLEAEQLKRKEEEIMASAVPVDGTANREEKSDVKTVGMTVVDEEAETVVVKEPETVVVEEPETVVVEEPEVVVVEEPEVVVDNDSDDND